LSRWVGLLRVESGPFEDASPIFMDTADPFIVRFKVAPIVWLSPEEAIPIHEDLNSRSRANLIEMDRLLP
jgi:hypothetical protein